MPKGGITLTDYLQAALSTQYPEAAVCQHR